MPHGGHPGVVTGLGCPLCDGTCRHGWTIHVHPTYPFLPKEMVDAMQEQTTATDADTPEQNPPARGRRRGQNRARQLAEHAAHEPGDDR